MKTYGSIIILSICLLCTSGCMMSRSSTASDPAKSILPKESQKVGGGFEISYLVPEDSTMVLMDKTTGKTIQTVSLREGESFDFTCRASDEKLFRDMGINIRRADFVLYSYPKRQKHTGTSTSAATQSAMLLPAPPQFYTPTVQK